MPKSTSITQTELDHYNKNQNKNTLTTTIVYHHGSQCNYPYIAIEDIKVIFSITTNEDDRLDIIIDDANAEVDTALSQCRDNTHTMVQVHMELNLNRPVW